MIDFERPCVCASCGREYVVSGTSANPTNETQVDVDFPCSCGGSASALIPGSANPERVRMLPKTQ